MKLKPLLMSVSMATQSRNNNKTVTRRIIKFNKKIINPIIGFTAMTPKGYFSVRGEHASGEYGESFFKMPFNVGDVLWVREEHYARGLWKKNGISKTGKQKYRFEIRRNEDFRYPDKLPPFGISTGRKNKIGWYKRPSLFMPKAACRLFLEITKVSIERLHDISEKDIVKEGVKYNTHNGYPVFAIEENAAYQFMPPGFKLNGSGIPITEKDLLFAHFAELWCKINGRKSWDENPWVWVVEFKKVTKPNNF
jgi:hypothetical protein